CTNFLSKPSTSLLLQPPFAVRHRPSSPFSFPEWNCWTRNKTSCFPVWGMLKGLVRMHTSAPRNSARESARKERNIMGAGLNRSVAKDGVIAYQDNQETNKFYYLPARIDAVLGETLSQFNVTYYGIAAAPYYMDMGNNLLESVVGGVMTGKA